MILTIRTDNPNAEVGLYLNDKQVEYKVWEAHRQLSETIHITILELLQKQGLTYSDLKSIVFYEGPGSFTGLRIGAAVANALAVGLNIPLVQAGGEKWITACLEQLNTGKSQAAAPYYGSEAIVTKPKK